MQGIFIFYKSKLFDGHCIDNIISLGTMPLNWGTGNYSHVEFWVPDEHGRFIDEEGNVCGFCYTSTMRGENDGTVCQPANTVIGNLDRWDGIKVDVAGALFALARANADIRVANNKGYAKKDLTRFVFPLNVHKFLGLYDTSREICSEHCETWAIDMDILYNVTLPSPRRLSKRLVDTSLEVKPLKAILYG